MPNIKSAKKRVVVTEKKSEANKAFVTSVKTTVKKFNNAVAAGEKENIASCQKETVKKLDTAAAKGYMHKNKAARLKSQMAKKVNSIG